MYWNACKNGDCSRYEKPTQERACPVCGDPTGSYDAPRTASTPASPANEHARRVAERRLQWSEATGVPLAASAGVPYSAALADWRVSSEASAWNYLWLLLGLIGGVVGNLMVRDTDPAMAKRLLVGGLLVTFLWPVLLLIILAA